MEQEMSDNTEARIARRTHITLAPHGVFLRVMGGAGNPASDEVAARGRMEWHGDIATMVFGICDCDGDFVGDPEEIRAGDRFSPIDFCALREKIIRKIALNDQLRGACLGAAT